MQLSVEKGQLISWKTHELEEDMLNSMILFLSKEGKKTSSKEYH